MRKILLFAAILILSTGAVVAQTMTTGVLEGAVAAEDGSPIVGAVITAVGPQGAQTQVTNDRGVFVFRGLVPGTYTVKAEADGYSTIIQSGVVIYISRRTQLPFSLPKGLQEEVTVTSEAPMVDMKSTTTGAQIKVDSFAPYVPLGRSLQSTVAIAPGVSDGGGTGTQNASISGSSGLENAYFVDGVNITNSGYGAIGAYSIVYGSLGTGVTYEFLEEVQVKTGGFEAEFGQAGGGVVNSVVKSGSNDFTVDASWYQTVGSMEGGRRDRELAPNTSNRVQTDRQDISISSGGPIIKDKLFYFAAYNPVKTDEDFKLTSGDAGIGYDLDGDGNATDFFNVGQTIQGGRLPGSVTRTRTIDNYAAKVSYFLTPNHKFDGTAFGDPSDGDVGPQSPTTFMRVLADPVANPDPQTSATGLDWGGDQYSFKYHGVWSPNFFTEVQYSHKKNTFEETGPGVQFRSIFDTLANNTSGGAGFFENLEDKTDQYIIKFTNVFGPVEVKYGYQYDDIDWSQPQQYSGPTYEAWLPRLTGNVVDVDGDGTASDYVIAGDGGLNDTSYQRLRSSTGASLDFNSLSGLYNVTRTAFQPGGEFTNAKEKNAFVQATWDVTPNVTIKGGFRWTEQELTGAGSFTLPLQNLGPGLAAGSTSYVPKTYTFDDEIAPRFGVTWDILGDGKHKIYANYGKYYQRVPSDLAVRQFSNEVGIENELFFDSNLTMPYLNTTCAVSDGEGGFTSVPCHIPTGTGASPGVILDGTQATRDFIEGIGLNFSDATNGQPSKLPYTEEWLAGYAWEINDYTSFEARYIHREIGRVLEDVQFASNEQIWNQFFGALVPGGEIFPGHGFSSFGAYVLANPGTNVNKALFPDPVRDYDALELIFNRRFHNSWMIYANYRLGRLRGNYEGSFRNDNGQSDPFITSLFDLPAASLLPDGTTVKSGTLAGQYTTGPLNTDRRHILNAFVSKQFEFGLNVGVRMTLQSGQPRFPLFAHPTYRNSGEIPGVNPTYWWLVGADYNPAVDSDGDGTVNNDFDGFGVFLDQDATQTTFSDQDVSRDGTVDTGIFSVSGPRLWSYDVVKRDFFGRNPWTYTFALHASYDFDLGKGKLTALLDVFNLFSDTGALFFDDRVELRPGVPNNNYLKPTGYQTPRQYRLGLRYHW